MTLPSQELEAKVEAVEKNKVIIRILPDQLLKVDRKFLTGEIEVGMPLKIEILTDKQASRRQAALGKAVLEEILNGGK